MTVMEYWVSTQAELQGQGLEKGKLSVDVCISFPESVLTILQEAELTLSNTDMRDLEEEFVSSRNLENTYKQETFSEEKAFSYCYA